MPRYADTPTEAAVRKAGTVFGYPLMLKAKRMAYDGKGNAAVRDEVLRCSSLVFSAVQELFALVSVHVTANEQLDNFGIADRTRLLGHGRARYRRFLRLCLLSKLNTKYLLPLEPA